MYDWANPSTKIGNRQQGYLWHLVLLSISCNCFFHNVGLFVNNVFKCKMYSTVIQWEKGFTHVNHSEFCHFQLAFLDWYVLYWFVQVCLITIVFYEVIMLMSMIHPVWREWLLHWSFNPAGNYKIGLLWLRVY